MNEGGVMRISAALLAGALLGLGIGLVCAAQDLRDGSPQGAVDTQAHKSAYLAWSGKASAPVATSEPSAPSSPANRAAETAAASAAAQQSGAPSDGRATVGARLYSLHREYGLDPDPVAVPKQRPLVLIAPPDPQPPDAHDDSDGSDDGAPDRKANPPDGQD
jgi:hypothetical protein